MVSASEVWTRAKPLLLPFEGMASQLYVLELPRRELRVVLDQFLSFTTDHKLQTLRSFSDEPRAFTDSDRAAILEEPNANCHHTVWGRRERTGPLGLWLWLGPQATSFDAELVFFADQAFPYPDDDSDCSSRFAEIFDFAELLRQPSPESQCVVSASETGHPSEDTQREWTCWW